MCAIVPESPCYRKVVARLAALGALVCILLALSAADASASGTITAVQRDMFRSVTCSPSCPAEAISSTGAGDLLFVEVLNTGSGSAGANIAGISCAPSSCGTWVYPGAACQAWTSDTAGEDCAYVLSSSAGATSITVTMTATSNVGQSISFREYHSTAGAFGLSGGPSVSLLSTLCTSCLTPNISVSGNNVMIAGGSPGHVFTGMSSPYGNAQIDNFGAIIGDNLNTLSGSGATLTQNASEIAAVFTIGFVSPAPLSITTSSLPSGQVGTVYSATLAVSGGTSSYTWSLTSGTLPAGLTLNASTGAITGTPTAIANATPLTFTVTDSSNPAQSKSVNLALTVVPFAFSVSLSPKRAGLTITQTLSVTATTNDSAGVSWSVSGLSCSGMGCGAISAASTVSGVPVTYTAPATAGIYTISATSITDGSTTASISVAVTALAGVATYHNDLSRDGANTQEYALTPSTVTTSTFGKLFSCAVDGAIYAQPLWVPNLTIASAKHNVVFVATQGDSVYAFDADSGGSSCTPLWHASLLDSAHGASSGETTVPSGPTNELVGTGNGDISPEVGVTSTPVIDLSTNTMYVVSKSVIPSGPTFHQRLHALDLLTGNEKFSGPVTIQGTYPGTGDGTSTTTFVPRMENQRSGLALVNGIVYIAWASHEDSSPYYGWVMGYNASNLSQASVLNVAPDAGWTGIWMSGGAPAADSSGNVYLITANGQFDATNASAPNNDYGDSFLKLTSGLSVSQYFTPSDQANDQVNDVDFGSGGAMVLVDLPANGSNPTHLVLGGGKDGSLYVLNRDAMGGYGDSNAWQELSTGGTIFSTGAYWNSTYYLGVAHYYGATQTYMQAYSLNTSTAKFTLLPNQTTTSFLWPGTTPSITSMPDNSNGIIWALQNNSYCTQGSHSCGPAILHAYNANNLSTEYWNSSMGTGNAPGYAVKFTVPTVANGKVYVGTRGNNTGGADNTTSTPGELDVYGLLPD